MLIQKQYFNFATNLNRTGNTTTILIIEEAKENILYFSKGTVQVW